MRYICIACMFFALMTSVSASLWDDATGELSCEYAGAYYQCKQAQESNASRSMTDPLCSPTPDPESILDQIILDVKFKELDEQAMMYLKKLDADKDAYFWPDAEAGGELRAIDDITKNFSAEGYYYKKYKELCDGWILAERTKCTGKIPNTQAALRIKGSETATACMNLVNFKLDAYRQIAYIRLGLNKQEVLEDSRQEYFQKERTKYDALLSNMQTILGYIGRLSQWVTHWTPNPLQSSVIELLRRII